MFEKSGEWTPARQRGGGGSIPPPYPLRLRRTLIFPHRFRSAGRVDVGILWRSRNKGFPVPGMGLTNALRGSQGSTESRATRWLGAAALLCVPTALERGTDIDSLTPARSSLAGLAAAPQFLSRLSKALKSDAQRVARAQACGNHDDLYAPDAPAGPGRAQPVGSVNRERGWFTGLTEWQPFRFIRRRWDHQFRTPRATIHFPGWAARLAAADLPERHKHSFTITIRWHFNFGRRGGIIGTWKARFNGLLPLRSFTSGFQSGTAPITLHLYFRPAAGLAFHA